MKNDELSFGKIGGLKIESKSKKNCLITNNFLQNSKNKTD